MRSSRRRAARSTAPPALDRTNYFETLPSHQLELALWLEADRMGTLLDALTQENLDNQRDVVKNEKRRQLRQPPLRQLDREAPRPPVSRQSHPYHHPTIGSMEDLDARLAGRRARVLRHLLRPQQRDPLGRRATASTTRSWPGPRSTSARSPPTPRSRRCPTCRCPRSSGEERRETVEDRVPLARLYIGFRAPVVRGHAPRRARARLPAADRRPESRLHKRLVRDERHRAGRRAGTWGFVGGASACLGVATVKPGVDGRAGRGGLLRGARAELATEVPAEDELARAKALTEADELGSLARVEERADRLAEYAGLFDDPDMINTLLPRYLAVTAEQIRDAAREMFRADNRVILTYVPGLGRVRARARRRRSGRRRGGRHEHRRRA